MSILIWPPKRAEETLDFVVDWHPELESDVIASSSWSVPSGITQVSASYTANKATIYLSGGTADETYELVNTITTVEGRTLFQIVSLEISSDVGYVKPVAADLTRRFPEFADVETLRVYAVIDEASRFVDNTWLEADYTNAILFLAAHMLAAEGVLTADGPAAQAGVTGPISSESLGNASVSYGSRTGTNTSVADAELSTTQYGTRFAELRRANHPPIMVI